MRTFSAFSRRGVGYALWAGGRALCLPNLPNEIFVALISSGLNLCCTYFIGAVNYYVSFSIRPAAFQPSGGARMKLPSTFDIHYSIFAF
jgi:hypothetical protein